MRREMLPQMYYLACPAKQQPQKGFDKKVRYVGTCSFPKVPEEFDRLCERLRTFLRQRRRFIIAQHYSCRLRDTTTPHLWG